MACLVDTEEGSYTTRLVLGRMLGHSRQVYDEQLEEFLPRSNHGLGLLAAAGALSVAAWRTFVALETADRTNDVLAAARDAEARGDFAKASELYAEGRALDPRDEGARLGLAHVSLLRGDVTTARAVLTDSPRSPAEAYLSAWTLASSDPTLARQILSGARGPHASALDLALRAMQGDASVEDDIAGTPSASPESDLHFARAYTALGIPDRAASHELRAAAAGLGEPVQPNIVLVVVDTLRADALGPGLTPELDAIARRSLVFDRAFSAAPWTGASIASLLTGFPPSVHGCADPMTMKVPDDMTTLAEALRAAGYTTAGVVANPQLDANRGFAQGFDRYSDTTGLPLPPGTKRRGDDVVAQVSAWLPELREPFFLFVHFMDPHWPFDPPGIADVPRSGTLTPAKTAALMETHGEQVAVRAEDLAYLRRLYAGEVAYLDVQVGALWAALDASGSELPQVRVLTADHGEEFQDHGSLGHGYTLHDEQVHVPLLVHAPGAIPARHVGTLAQLVTVMPTLLELAGAAEIAHQEPGSSDAWLGLAEGRATSAFSEGTYLGQWRAIRTDDRALFYTPLDGNGFVFDLTRDPHELHPLDGGLDAPEAGQPLAALLAWMDTNARVAATTTGPDRVTLTKERAEQLRALGYVGTTDR
jgi:arylsulfatase A-like enzyme